MRVAISWTWLSVWSTNRSFITVIKCYCELVAPELCTFFRLIIKNFTLIFFLSSTSRRLHHKLTAGCFPFHESKKREKDAFQLESLEDMLLEDSARIAKRLSECSFASVQSYVFPVASAVRPPPHIPFIDECTSTVASEDEHEAGRNASRLSSSTVDVENGFYSDSGFSSELYDSSLSHSKSNSFGRAARWTTSFRKLIKRVSSKKQPQTTEN